MVISLGGKDSQPPGLSVPKNNRKSETFLVKIFSLKQQNQIPPATTKKSNLHFPRKRSMIPLDKELQWVNVKQKPFRQI